MITHCAVLDTQTASFPDSTRSCPGCDLRRARLFAAELVGADLRDADLYWANLKRADLRGALLDSADLRGARLDRADLRRVRARGAHWLGASLRGVFMHEPI